MQVSVRKAINNVFSDKYDKKNTLVLILIMLLTSVITFAFYNDITVEMSKIAEMNGINSIPLPFNTEIGVPGWAIIPAIILLLLWLGMWTVGVHNAIHNKPGIIPNIGEGKTTTECLLTSIKCVIGIIGLSVIYGIISILFALIPIIGILFDIVLYILFIFLLIVLLSGFYINLRISSLFDFKRAFTKLQKHFGHVIIYVLKCICLGIIVIILSGIIGLIMGIMSAFINNPAQTANIMLLTAALSSIINAMFCIINIDLSAQLAKIIYPPMKKASKEQTFGETKEEDEAINVPSWDDEMRGEKDAEITNEPYPTIDIGPDNNSNNEDEQ